MAMEGLRGIARSLSGVEVTVVTTGAQAPHTEVEAERRAADGLEADLVLMYHNLRLPVPRSSSSRRLCVDLRDAPCARARGGAVRRVGARPGVRREVPASPGTYPLAILAANWNGSDTTAYTSTYSRCSRHIARAI